MYLSHIDQVYATYLSGVSSVGTLSVILVQGVLNMRVMEARNCTLHGRYSYRSFDWMYNRLVPLILIWGYLRKLHLLGYICNYRAKSYGLWCVLFRHSINLTLRLFLFKWHYKMRVYSVVIPLEVDCWKWASVSYCNWLMTWNWFKHFQKELCIYLHCMW